jgi:hypothetical protein
MLKKFPTWRAEAPYLAFAPEWGCVAVAAGVDLLLLSHTSMRFHVDGTHGCLLLFPLTAIAVLLRKLGSGRVADTLECLALMGAGSLVMCVATYVGWAYAGSFLWDARFDAIGKAMGFNWLAWYHMVAAHPRTAAVLAFLYVHVGFQTLYFCILMGITRNLARMRETFRVFFVGLVITAVIACAMPAMGALPFHGLKGAYPFIEKARLHAGGPLDFSLDRLTGVVTFPSFHVVMILAFSYAFRGTGLIGWLILAANLVTLFGVPVFGGHFLIDMIGGAGVFVAAVAVVRFASVQKLRQNLAQNLARPGGVYWPVRQARQFANWAWGIPDAQSELSAASASPEYAAACDDAYLADAPSR